MTILRIEFPVPKSPIVLYDIAAGGGCQQLVPIVHLLTEGGEGVGGALRVGDDHLILVRDLCHEELLHPGVHAKLDHLRVDHHKLQLRWMLLVEQGHDDRIESHRLSLSRSTRHEEVGYLSEVKEQDIIRDRATECHRELHLRLPIDRGGKHTPHADDLGSLIGHLHTNGPLTGDRRNDTNTERRETHRYIVLQTPDAGDMDPCCRDDLIERDRRTDRGGDLIDLDPEALECVEDQLLIRIDLLHVDLPVVAAVVLE